MNIQRLDFSSTHLCWKVVEENSSEPVRNMIESEIKENGFVTMQEVLYLEFYNE